MFRTSLLAALVAGLPAVADAQLPLTGAGPEVFSSGPPPVLATWDPTNVGATITLSGGNLIATATGSTWNSVLATKPHSTGTSGAKFYFEFTFNTVGSNGSIFGLGTSSTNLSNYAGVDTASYGFQCVSTTTTQVYWNSTTPFGINAWEACHNGDTYGIAIDLTGSNPKMWVKNITTGGQWNLGSGGTNDPTTGAGGFSLSSISGSLVFIFSGETPGAADQGTLNAGQSSYLIPSGILSALTAAGFGNL